MNYVTFKVEAIPENKNLIDDIGAMIIGSEPNTVKKDTVKKDTVKKGTEEVSLADFKEAAKAAKKEHGEEFVISVLTSFGTPKRETLAKTVAAAPKKNYDEMVSMFAEGPSENEGDDDWGEEGGDEDVIEEITVEAVRDALKAYAKTEGRDEAKALMQEHGIASLPKLKDASKKALAAIMKEIA